MFSRSSRPPSSALRKPASTADGAPFSIIGADVVISGNIYASVDLHIDGRIEGDITCAGLVQGRNSAIVGHVRAKSVRLAGLIDGSIDAGELIVESNGRVTGDVHYDSISIAPGAEIDGRFARREGDQEPALPSGGDLKLISNDQN